jgi:hypothetical protein
MNNYKNYNQEQKEEKKEKLIHFNYKLKLRTAIIGFVLYLLLSTTTAFKVLQIIVSSFFNNIDIINEQNEPSFLSKLIMAFIIAIILFIF